MPTPLRSSRLVLPGVLLAGVALATLGFARSQGAWRARRSEELPHGVFPQAAGEATSRPGATAGTGDVAVLFRRRVQELEARLEDAPGDRRAMLELARLLHDGHRVGDAVARYREALELDPADAQVTYDLASALGEMGRWEEAAEVLSERVDAAPQDAVALYDLGAVRANQGRTEAARRHMEAALEVATDGALRARISQTLARLGGS
ncbi:MAG: hypothetical protein AMXMBFR53_13260 [Gemmatimonadota bacterium]